MTTNPIPPCSDPENGEAYLYDYLDEDLPEKSILTSEQRHTLERHLFVEQCPSCLDFFENPHKMHRVLEKVSGLRVTSILDEETGTELIDLYDKESVTVPLAASTAGQRQGPKLKITYEDGLAKGKFFRDGTQLFFALQLSKELPPPRCGVLSYSSTVNPGKPTRFKVQDGEEKRLGSIAELCPEFTIEEMLKTIRRFTFTLQEGGE